MCLGEKIDRLKVPALQHPSLTGGEFSTHLGFLQKKGCPYPTEREKENSELSAVYMCWAVHVEVTRGFQRKKMHQKSSHCIFGENDVGVKKCSL